MEIALLVVNAVLLLVIGFQSYEVRNQRQEAEKERVDDHLRRRRQATIEFYSSLRTSRQAFREAAEHYANRDLMTDEQVRSLLGSVVEGDEFAIRARQAIESHLSGLEWFAVGVNTKVFDLEVADRLGGSHFIRTSRMFDRYIAARRREVASTTLYEELQTLAHSVQTLRNRSNSAGEIEGYD